MARDPRHPEEVARRFAWSAMRNDGERIITDPEEVADLLCADRRRVLRAMRYLDVRVSRWLAAELRRWEAE